MPTTEPASEPVTDGPATIPASTAFRVATVALLVGVLAVRLWSVSRSTWLLDDWVYMQQAREMGFVDFLFQNYNGHLMPGEFLMVWLTTTVAPLAFAPVVIWVAVASTAATGLWALALREMCGERWPTLVPLALVALSPLHVQGTIWWAAALQTIPMQATIAGCAYFTTRLARHGRRSDRIGLLLTYAGGLVMWEKMALVAIPIAGVMVYLAPLEPGRWARILREGAFVAVLAAGYAVVYLALTRKDSTGQFPVGFKMQSAGAVARSFGDLTGYLLAPGLLGGPWGTLPTPGDLQAHPAGWQVALTGVVAVVVLAALAVLRRSAWVPVTMVVLFAGISWGLLAFSTRLDFFGLTKNGYERYAADSFLVLCLAVALWLTPEAHRRAAGRRPESRRVRVAGAGVFGLVVASLAVGNVVAVDRLGVSPGKDWVTTVQQELADGAPVTVIDGYAPDRVLFAPFFGPYARLSGMLGPVSDQVRFGGVGEPLHLIDPDGHLVPVTVSAATSSRSGPNGDCGYGLGPGESKLVRMTKELYRLDWVLQVDAYAATAGGLDVEVGDDRVSVPIRAGLNSPQSVVVTDLDEPVRITSTSTEGVICVTDIELGTATGGAG